MATNCDLTNEKHRPNLYVCRKINFIYYNGSVYLLADFTRLMLVNFEALYEVFVLLMNTWNDKLKKFKPDLLTNIAVSMPRKRSSECLFNPFMSIVPSSRKHAYIILTP